MRKRAVAILPASLLIAMGLPVPAHAVTPWTQDFENNTDGWFENADDARIKRVASGTGGIESAGGSNHAVMSAAGMFTRFGAYAAEWDGTWRAEVDVHLDPAWAAGTGFDYTVAANGSNGSHRRDFVFHVAKDESTDQLLVGASNNTSFAPRQDLETGNHAEITEAGWYTLRHTVRNEAGVLAVDMALVDADGTVVFEETRQSALDTMDLVGGNRYGWFTALEGTDLAIDNSRLYRLAGGAGRQYRTGFAHEAITEAATDRWHKSGPYDAAIETIDGDAVLRISNAKTAGSFGDMLFAPTLTVAATEAEKDNVFDAQFTIEPTSYQEGLAVTVSPDNGSGGRNGWLRISHEQDETMTVQAAGSYIDDEGELQWRYEDVATGLDLSVPHVVQMQVVKRPSGTPADINDVFRVSVDDSERVELGTFEAYYYANQDASGVSEANHPTRTLMFRTSGTAAPTLLGKGLLIDDLSMSVSTEEPVEPPVDPGKPETAPGNPDPGTPPTTNPGNPDPGTPPVTPPAKAATAKAKAVSGKSKMYVNVNPNKGRGFWKVRIEKKTKSGWKTLKKTYRTKGKVEKLTVNLPKGTYRAKVLPKYGYETGYSQPVKLKR